MKLVFILIFIWFYCILSNAYWLLKSKKLYNRFISGKEMSSYIPEVDEIFNHAGTSYQTYYDENKGGYRQRSLVPVAYTCDKKKYFDEANKVFLVTIGTFRQRLKHSVFPIHLLFLPSCLAQSKKISIPIIVKIILNGIYWILVTLAGYLLNSFLDYAYLEHIQKLFEKIL